MSMIAKLRKARNQKGKVTIPLSRYQELLVREGQFFDMQDEFFEWGLLKPCREINYHNVSQVREIIEQARKDGTYKDGTYEDIYFR